MKHIFIPTPKGSHTRLSDEARGDLKQFPDTAEIAPLSALVDPADFALVPKPPVPVIIPSEIANWRARAVLEIAGLLPSVETALAALTGDEGIVARAAWNSGAPFLREGPTVTSLAAALSLSSGQVDAMFLQAAALTV